LLHEEIFNRFGSLRRFEQSPYRHYPGQRARGRRRHVRSAFSPRRAAPDFVGKED
jgi:hypothetical protein